MMNPSGAHARLPNFIQTRHLVSSVLCEEPSFSRDLIPVLTLVSNWILLGVCPNFSYSAHPAFILGSELPLE